MFDVNDSLTMIGFLVNEEDNIDFEIFFDISSTLGVHQKDIKIFSFIDIKTKHQLSFRIESIVIILIGEVKLITRML